MFDTLKNITAATPSHVDKKTVKVKSADLNFFVSQLSIMLDSGVTLSDAIEAVAEQTNCPKFQDVLFSISDRIQNGESFSATLESYPKIFSPMFVSIVEASEVSGKMTEMLDVLNDYLESEMDTMRQVKNALVYPCIMMVMAFVATATLLFFVLPKFSKIYESRGQALPKLTQILMSASKIVGDLKSTSITITVTVLFVGGIIYGLRTKAGQDFLDYLKIKTPVLGTMFIDTIMTRSTRIMATMLNTGVTLLDSLAVVEKSADNKYFKAFWHETYSRIETGMQLSESMKIASNSELVSPAIMQMIKAGENGGNLDMVCDKISKFYDKKLKSSIKNVTTMIEPLMITIMGVIIGTIAIALLLPIFRISSVVGH